MPVIYQKFYYREDLKANPKALYLFGDNDMRAGLGGQAKECRGEPNAVGIRTKKKPATSTDAFWFDRTLDRNKFKVDEDLIKVVMHLRKDGVVIVPLDGIGTGRGEMLDHCPETFYYLKTRLDSLGAI